MASVDEDIIPTSRPDLDDDPDDSPLDSRLLASLNPSSALLKRGDKDFEPHALRKQTDALTASRNDMHGLLSVGRVHQPKNHMLAFYDVDRNMASVKHARGTQFSSMGRAKAEPAGKGEKMEVKTWLLPEECLYLLERGTLDVRWPRGGASDGDEPELGVPMSLQAAYAALLGREELVGGKLTLEKYMVYTALRRAGYVVLRADDWDGLGAGKKQDENEIRYPSEGVSNFAGFWTHLWTRLFATEPGHPPHRLSLGPLVTPGLYRSWDQIYRLTSIIPFHDPTVKSEHSPSLNSASSSPDSSPFHVHFHVYKATGSSSFRKSDPGPPDFRISVINARETSLPSLIELSNLLASTPYNPPSETASLYPKLKHGYRNVLLAVVDQGMVSYVRVGEAAFGREKLWARRQVPRQGGKAGGGKRGSGRAKR